jgi:CRP/FNR family transcriptional regulator, cyclic AMP receptor protein
MIARVPGTKADLLKTVPLFAGLNAREIDRVARLMDEVDVKRGKVLTREGRSGGEFFIVAAGEVEVRRAGRRLTTLGAGDFLGEIALIDKGPRTATATTTADSRLLVLARREFHSMLGSNPKVEAKILRTLAERVRSLSPRQAH